MNVDFLLLLMGTGLLTAVTIGWLQPMAEHWSSEHDKDL